MGKAVPGLTDPETMPTVKVINWEWLKASGCASQLKEKNPRRLLLERRNICSLSLPVTVRDLPRSLPGR